MENVKQLTANQLYKYFVEKRAKGMEYDEMRTIMQTAEIDNKTISMIISQIDSAELRGLIKKKDNNSAKSIIGLGVVVALIGIVVSFFSIFSGNGGYLFYGLILTGIVITVIGAAKMRE